MNIITALILMLIFSTLILLILRQRRVIRKTQNDLSEIIAETGMTSDEMILQIKKMLHTNTSEYESIVSQYRQMISNLLNDTLSVKSGFNEILQGAAEVGKKTEEKMSLVGEAAETSKNIVLAVASITENMNEQVETFKRTIPRLERFITKTSIVRKKSSESRNSSEKLVDLLLSGKNTMNQTSKAIEKIAEAEELVRQSLSRISSIAAQINILAMNAAIQASHAGDAGRGFAVVASEVRVLAEDSAKTVDSISTEIEEMDKRVKTGRELTEKTISLFSSINKDLSSSNNLINEIDKTLEQQLSEAEEMIPELESLVFGITRLKDSTSEEQKKTDTIESIMDQISLISSQIQIGEKELIAKDYEVLNIIDQILNSLQK